MDQPRLLPELEAQQRKAIPPTRPQEARVIRAVHGQVEWLPCDLEVMVPEDHPARAIWGLVEHLDLRAFYGDIAAVADGPGRPASDPKVLLALWLLATVEGVGSARHLDRLCELHLAYRWLCGGVPVNYHLLADFRVAHEAELDQVLTQIIASLMASGAVTLQAVAQDGMKVRASAGAASFRRRERLETCLAEAQAQVLRLKAEREHPDPGVNRRQQAARERAVREREVRVRQALEHLATVEVVKARQRAKKGTPQAGKVKAARASTTDPEARVMKLADGGFRPALNLQLVTDVGSGVIVGVAAVNGEDAGQAGVLEQQVEDRTGRRPDVYLMDGGFAQREDLTLLTQRGLTVYAPVKASKNDVVDPVARYRPHERDTPEVVAWRARMATPEAQGIYRQRAATAEWANAQVRKHGLGQQLTVRGLRNTTSVLLLAAIAHNLLRWAALTVTA